MYLLLPDQEQLAAVDTEDYRLGSQHRTLWAQDLFEVAAASDSRTAWRAFQGEEISDARVAELVGVARVTGGIHCLVNVLR